MKGMLLLNGLLSAVLFVAGVTVADEPPPHFRVDPSGQQVGVDLWGHGWKSGAQLTVTIGKSVDESAFNTTTPVDEHGNWGIWDDTYQVEAGDYISVSDGETSIDNYVVTGLTLSEVDDENNTVSGTAAAGSTVSVHIHDAGVGRQVTADPDGNWMADFNEPVGDGQGWNGTADLSPETPGAACQCPDDLSEAYGATHIGFGHTHPDDGITIPHFLVSLDQNGFDGMLWWHVSPWLPDALIQITIGDPTEPDHLFSVEDVWSDGDGYWEVWSIDFDIQPHDLITISDGVTTVTHTVRDLEIEAIDVEQNQVTGWAAPGSWVGVSIHDVGVFRSIEAGPDGFWVADFSASVGDEPWDEAHDIQPGDFGWVIQDHEGEDPHGTPREAPYGATILDWSVPSPRFYVNARSRALWGREWPAGETLVVSIGHDLEDPLFSDAVSVGGDGRWWLDDVSIDIVPGLFVQVQGGSVTKTHEVRSLAIVGIDADANTVSGTANPGAWVSVHIHRHGIRREIEADGEGAWLVDFSDPVGFEPWEAAFDIQEGTEGDVNIHDDDGDATYVVWRHSNEPVDIFLGWLELDETLNEFCAEVMGGGILGVRVRTPQGVWHAMTVFDWWGEEWEFIAEETTYPALDERFPYGEYRFEITTSTGVSTSIVEVAESMARPNAAPVILSPADAATTVAWPEVPLTWEAVADPNFSLLLVEVVDRDDVYDVGFFLDDVTTTTFLMTELEPETDYEVVLAFGNLMEGETSEGVSYRLLRARVLFSAFSTGTEPQPEMQARLAWYGNKAVTLDPGETWSKAENQDRFGKGLTLRQEYIADTDPNDPESIFRIDVVDILDGVSISFEPNSVHRVYTVQSRNHLHDGDWMDVETHTNVPGGEPLDVPANGSASFFRVRVGLPE